MEFLNVMLRYKQGCSGVGTRWNFGAGTALRQIGLSLATGGTLTLKRSGQITSYSLGWPSISLFSGPNCSPNAGFGIKNLKKISGGDTLGPPQQEGATPSRTHPQHGYTP